MDRESVRSVREEIRERKRVVVRRLAKRMRAAQEADVNPFK